MHYQRDRAKRNPCAVGGCKSVMSYRATGFCTGHQRQYLGGKDLTPTPSGKLHKAQYTGDGRKICKSCDEALPLSEFHKDARCADGYRAQCKPCRNGYMKTYHAATGDARRDYMRKRMAENGDRVRELDRLRYERDKEKRVALASENVKIRRARLAGVETDPGVTVPALRKIHGDNCCYCGVEMTFKRGKRGDGIAPNRATLEHVVPITKGGGHTFANTALACHRCNVTKNNKTTDEWAESRGLLWISPKRPLVATA